MLPIHLQIPRPLSLQFGVISLTLPGLRWFSPIVISGGEPADDLIQIYGYLSSGFAPVLSLTPADDPDATSGHAVCAVGVRCGEVKPQTDPKLTFREESSCLSGLSIHDDRLGPYAFAELSPLTDKRTGKVRTSVSIQWPDKTPDRYWLVHALIVPVPQKLNSVSLACEGSV